MFYSYRSRMVSSKDEGEGLSRIRRFDESEDCRCRSRRRDFRPFNVVLRTRPPLNSQHPAYASDYPQSCSPL